jgi:ribonuclease HII
MPHFDLEREAGGLVVGIDEAGRGPWAGPVVAAAALIIDPGHLPDGIDDSKKLSRNRREALFDPLLAAARVGVGQASPGEIDELNILAATMLAMRRALEDLCARHKIQPDFALIDGNRLPADLPCPARAVVRGDATSLSIAAASIVAKVTRDRIMTRLDEENPGYGWARNAGYGTAEHQAGLARLGVTAHHRTTYAPIRHLLESS